jgi:hypothetical protein
MKDEAGVDAVLAEFEAESLSKREWTHGTHLDETVITDLSKTPFLAVVAEMRGQSISKLCRARV